VARSAQKTAAAEPVVEKPAAEEPPKDTTTKATTDTAAGKDNLTGLGDAMVAGLSQGRMQQVDDQTKRVTADAKGYTPYDPYTGSFVGQGPYNTGTTKTGQV
jgi:hypothetical protein